MKLNLNKLYKIHSFTAFMLLFLTIVGCIQATFMFGPDMSTKYVWLPSIPFIIWGLIILVLAMYKQWAAFILGFLEVLFTLQTFETFLQIPTWEISFDPYSFATSRFTAELIAIFNLIFLITSAIGTYLFIKKLLNKSSQK